MGVGNLLSNLLKKEKIDKTCFLSLILQPDKVTAIIWAFNQEQVDILGHYTKSIGNIDNLVHQSAEAIDKAASIAQNDVSKVTYGLSQNWLEEDGKLTKDTSRLLKNLSEDLDLDAQAFIPFSAAVNHLLKIEESVTPRAVLVGLFENFCEVHLVENNSVIKSKSFKAKVNITNVKNLITQLKSPSKDLPARIVVYGSTSPDIIKKTTYEDWQDIFENEPKIDIMDSLKLSQAVASAQAADILGYEPTLLEKGKINTSKAPPISNQLGFVEGEDILLDSRSDIGNIDKPEDSSEETEPAENSPKIESETFPHTAPTADDLSPDIRYSPKTDQGTNDENQITKTAVAQRAGITEDLVSIGWLPNLLKLIGQRKFAKKMIFGLIGIVLILIVGTFVGGQFLTSAEVIIKVKSDAQENNFTAQVLADNFSEGSQKISGAELTSTQSGSQKAVATGSKKLGEKAKGPITAFNWTVTPVAFPKETVIISKNGLKFILDSDVKIASRSASIPGQSNTGVTAVEFGPSGNVSSGTDFTIQGYDELLYSARSDSAFSGGDEKQVTVVSQEDLDGLKKSLTQTLSDKAKASLMEKANGRKIHSEAIIVTVKNLRFDKKVDEEASLVNLEMEVVTSSIVYDQVNLRKYLAESLKDRVSNDLEARGEDIDILETSAKINDNILVLSGRFRAKIVPKFDLTQLKDKIAGKSVKESRSIIKENTDVGEVEVDFSPSIFLTNTLPRNKDKINIKV